MPFDTYDAQRINPHPAGTYRDTPQMMAERQKKWGQPNISPLRPKRKSAERAAAKRARYNANRQARAAHYAEYDGEVKDGRCVGWHSTLNALSAGAL